MTALPGNVSVCGVKGHFAYARLAPGDADGIMDLVPVVGLVVTLTPSPTYLLDATATPPTVIVPDPLVLTTDVNGDLRDVDGNSTAYVIASDDADLNPHDWTYTVSFSGPASSPFAPYSAAFPGGQTVDLSLITPIPSALGISVSVAQAAEAAAAAYAASAADARDTAVAATATKVDKGTLVFNVKDYGAVGDGTTDDTAAIQAGINAATAAGAKLYFPPGTYIISGRTGYYVAVLTFVSNTYLFGDGQGGAVLKVANGQTAAGDYGIFAPATSNLSTVNVTFENLTIDGNASNNIVLGSAGGNIRAARPIRVPVGSNIRIEGCEFRNIPGRNVIMIGNGSTTPVNDVTIKNNRFYNVGGAISGNEAQDDHTCIYSQSFGALIAENQFWNDSPINWTSAPSRVVCAIEAHGSNTVVRDNLVRNFTAGARSVAVQLDARNNIFRDNVFLDVTEIGLDIWTISPYVNQGTSFIGNKIRLYGAFGTETAGIYQPFGAGGTTSEPQDLEIKNNLIWSDYTSSASADTGGILLAAVKRCVVSGNTIRNMQGAGVFVRPPLQAGLVVEDLTIEDNLILDVALSATTTHPFAIQNFVDTGFTHSRVTVRRNRIGASSTTGAMRGIRLQGPGTLSDAVVHGDNVFHNIADPANMITTLSTTNFLRVTILPRITSGPAATNPTDGVWIAGQDIILHVDATASSATGKIVTTSGGASSGVWAATTAYTFGQWIRTSTGKVMKCIGAGTSSSTEPNPTTLGAVSTDGTVTWAYRAAAAAVFSPYGGPLGVDLTTAQAVAGVKTFSSSPIVPTPTTPSQAATKGYVDAAAAGDGWQIARPPWAPHASTLVTIGTANTCWYYRVVGTQTISKIRVGLGVSSGNISVAAYSNSGTGTSALPGSLLASSGSVACPPGAASADVSLGSSVTVNAGDWLAIACDNLTATFTGINGGAPAGFNAGMSYQQASAFPCPSTVGTLTAANNRLIALIGTA